MILPVKVLPQASKLNEQNLQKRFPKLVVAGKTTFFNVSTTKNLKTQVGVASNTNVIKRDASVKKATLSCNKCLFD